MQFGGDDFFGMPMSLGQTMFMAEEEGVDDMVTTRKTRIKAICNDIDEALDYSISGNITDKIDDIIEGHGIDIDSLTQKERNLIDKHLYRY